MYISTDINRATGGVPETPKDPPRNIPAGVSPSPDWQRCLFLFSTSGHRPRGGHLASNQGMPVQVRLTAPIFRNQDMAGASSRSGNSKSPRVRGSTGTPCHSFSHFQTRGSQVVRQRSHTPRIAGSNPASATIFPSTGRSIIQQVIRLASGRARCKAVAVHHSQPQPGW